MFKNTYKRKLPALSINLIVAFVLIGIVAFLANTELAFTAENPEGETDGQVVQQDAPQTSHRLIVELESPSLAVYAAEEGLARLENGRLDLQSGAAQAYAAQLEAEQAAFVQEMAAAYPDLSVASYINEQGATIEATYQVVFNGVAVDAGAADNVDLVYRELHKLPGVRAVYRDYAHYPQTYTSTTLINAPALWNLAGGQDDAGSGVKVASMDGGLHHDAAMFDGTGWDYPAGWPAGGLGDAANNNGKIIASRAYFRDWDPPAPGDENTWPGTNGTSHGTHTGSTAGGNRVDADYLGVPLELSGVAPGSWLMSYRVFYASVTNDGSFYTVEGIAALEDLVADGADVVNNSWGGGPGSVGGEFDPLDQALINASAAGVFVSMSAGNAGPGNGTTDHPSPDYINVAASTTSGTFSSGRLNVTAPEPISPTLQNIPFATANFGSPLPIGTVFTYTFVTAASVDPGNFDGCDPWTGTPFTGQAAIISRGSCEFGVKVLNAEQAGAEFVIVYNNAGDGLVSMAPGAVGNMVTIPSIFIGQTNGEGMSAWYDTHGNASVLEMDTLAFQAGNTPDRIIGFSSRGPGVGNVLKPDIAAPGVNIVAQGYGPGSGEQRHLGFGQVSGTSMAAPHVAGSAALLKEIHPEWSNADIKSALMSTAKYLEIYNFDGSPAQPLDMGAGRLDLTNAADPGVLLDPPSLSYGLMLTGTVHTMTVQVTSVATATETYSLTTLYTGDGFAMTTDLPGFSVSPTAITLDPDETEAVQVVFDSAQGMGLGDNQGYIVMTGDQGHDAHMPAWARVAPPSSADVLLIDNDFSELLGFPDYTGYYTETLEDLGLTYDYWSADANFGNPTTIPDGATLSSYKAVIYFTGDNFYPDGTFTVQTPLTSLDMNRLTEYANGGGIVLAMGQDMSGVLDDSFFDDSVLGDEQLQDSVTGFGLPDVPVVARPDTPPALSSVSVDLGGASTNVVPLTGANEVPPVATTMSGEGSYAYDAANQVLDYHVELAVTVPTTVTASHIHSGTVGVNGPVVFNISPPGVPILVTDTLSYAGSILLDDAQEAQLLAEGFYVNVHTPAYPGGEVRGQVVAAVNGDGAGNQFYMDEMAEAPNFEPNPVPGLVYPYMPLLTYPDPTYHLETGTVAMAHRAQPSLEYPGISYFGRSIYTSFGLEGINDGLGTTSRSELLGAFLDWAMDEPTAIISQTTDVLSDTTQVVTFDAHLSSNVGASGHLYRWDFGDGSDFAGPYSSNTIGHTYDVCGTYTVRVEVIDTYGNHTIGSAEVEVTQACSYISYTPIIHK